MRRVIALGILMSVGGLALSVRAYQQGGQPPAMVVQVEQLKDNLYVLRGGGGNTAVFVQANGVTVVDTKNPGWGQPILTKIRELTDKPVTTIINTHTHGDHVSGNVEFPASVDVVVHERTRENMQRMASPSGFAPSTRNIFQENSGRGLPTRAFGDQLTLGSGADRIDLRYFGRGHTNGDAWVIFPALRVAHAGDIFSGKNMPILDANNGGSGVEMPDTLTNAHGVLAASVDAIITGHSAVMTPGDLREYAEFNRDFLNAVRAGRQAGRTVDEIAAGWTIPEKYQGYAAPQAARVRTNVDVVFNELGTGN